MVFEEDHDVFFDARSDSDWQVADRQVRDDVPREVLKEMQDHLEIQEERIKNLSRVLRLCNFMLDSASMNDRYADSVFIDLLLKRFKMSQIDLVILAEKVEKTSDVSNPILGAIECLRCVSLNQEFKISCPPIASLTGLDETLKEIRRNTRYTGATQTDVLFGPTRLAWYR